jgi:hypothetical protein
MERMDLVYRYKLYADVLSRSDTGSIEAQGIVRHEVLAIEHPGLDRSYFGEV